jgi:YggT family protein
MGCLVAQALGIYSYILLARILLSWLSMGTWSPPAGLQPVIGFIFDVTEPVMAFARRYIPPLGPVDISPIFIFLALSFISGALC